jgi:uncharacterized protein
MTRLFICFLVGIAAWTSRAAAADAPPAKIKVLIVDGYSNHDWQLTTRLIRAVIDRAGVGPMEPAVSGLRCRDPELQ